MASTMQIMEENRDQTNWKRCILQEGFHLFSLTYYGRESKEEFYVYFYLGALLDIFAWKSLVIHIALSIRQILGPVIFHLLFTSWPFGLMSTLVHQRLPHSTTSLSLRVLLNHWISEPMISIISHNSKPFPQELMTNLFSSPSNFEGIYYKQRQYMGLFAQ